MGISIGPRMVARGNGVEAAVFAPPFRLLAAGLGVRSVELQNEPGPGAAVGFHQKALPGGDPADEGLCRGFELDEL